MIQRFVMLTACLLLGACAGAPERDPVAARPLSKAPAELLLEVRQAALDVDDALEVSPLAEPVVADLLQQAANHEAGGDFSAALRAIEQALALSPDAPTLLQAQAEYLLANGQLDAAERVAARAYELGPKLGPLCRRSWATVRLAREERGNPAAGQTAAEQARRCATAAPVRM